MRFVEQAAIRPHHCAVFPHIGSNHREGFFDTGSELPGFDNHVYVSVAAVREMARLPQVDMVAGEELRDALDELAQLRRRLAQLEDEVADLNRDFEAIDVLASRGFQARKKPGRPVKTKEIA